MKIWLKWFVVNSLFTAFFIFQNYLPPFIFSGGYFVIWLMTVLVIPIFAVAIIIYSATEDSDGDFAETVKKAFRENEKSALYYKVDFYYDVFMLFVFGGMGHYVYAVFYAVANILIALLRNIVKTTE